MDKLELRARFCTTRECLEARHVTDASAAICRRLARMTVVQEAGKILTYLAFRNEPDLAALVDVLPGIAWIVPRIDREGLVLHRYDPDSLLRHAYGMLEPLPSAPVVEPAELDVVLVPGVSFDRQGGRLGFGGGFYDRLLIRTSAVRIGITYDACLADALPCDAHDQRMDWVVTPSQAIRCGPLWRSQHEFAHE
ncbi:MAG: 5-formyltetrahydrofolate cyclo-ligase [Anaerolineae bacterium]